MSNFTYLNENMGAGEDDGDDGGDTGFDRSFTATAEDDYYGFLNLPRDAKTEDIQIQYRKLSKMYHPDKHTDEDSKAKAEKIFSKLKSIHEVLMDPEKRAIYDTLGVEALKEAQSSTSNMQLVTRYRTPLEIREEFERIQTEREEQRLERQANPKGSITVNINASEIFAPYVGHKDEDMYYDDAGPFVELTGFHFFQSIEAPLTTTDTITMSGSVSAENGRGKGNIMAGFRKTFGSRQSAEVEVGGSTNGIDFGFKGYTMLGSRFHATSSLACQSTQEGLRPAGALSLGCSIDDRSNGQISWRFGALPGVQTQYIWDSSITRFVASAHVGIPHSFVSFSASRRLENKKMRVRGVVRGGTFGIYTEYGIEKKVSQMTTLSATMVVGVPVGISLRLKILRSNQSYIFPIRLCDQVLPAPIVYGTIAPLVLWVVVNKLFVGPYERERVSREKAKLKAQHKARMTEKQAEAKAAVQLMNLAYDRIVAEESAKHGLVITAATYGRFLSGSSNPLEATFNEDEIVDVTIPLQCLVKDSRLILHDTSKANLPGFYDPIPWEEKTLLIQYQFRDRPHSVMLKDEEPVSIPREAHQLRQIAT